MLKKYVGPALMVVIGLAILLFATGLSSAPSREAQTGNTVTIAAAGDIASCDSNGVRKRRPYSMSYNRKPY